MTNRTSATNPLRIDAVQAGQASGLIGMTFCPGKRQLVSMSGGWQRDLVVDLEAVGKWDARVIVSLMEDHEFDAVGVSPAEFARIAAEHGMEWARIAIRDGSTPDASSLDRWRGIAPRLQALLDRGERIIIHCLGGLGRTGMMAACLLVETGIVPEEAIAAVRTARAGTIETEEQEEFVLRYTPAG